MKHIEPPENLPVVPEPPVPTEPRPTETVPEEDVHFRDPRAGDTVSTAPAEDIFTLRDSAPAPRSLQPLTLDMTQRKERPFRAPDDLLSVDDVAERLLVSRAAVYRLVSRRLLPVYRLPGSFRFRASDVDGYLAACRTEAAPIDPYVCSQDQR